MGFFNSMNNWRKGQEGAPIELLIGVTILTFVMIIGLFSFRNVCSSNYEQSLRASTSLFARTMEIAYLGSLDSSQIVDLDFSAPQGCSSDVESVRMLKGLLATCMAQTGQSDCLELVVVVRDKQGNYGVLISEVLNIPSSTLVLYTPPTTSCPVVNAYGDIVFSSISGDTWNNEIYKECGWKPVSYKLKITKTKQNEIRIGPVV